MPADGAPQGILTAPEPVPVRIAALHSTGRRQFVISHDLSQVGGHPGWIQDAEYPDCPSCRTPMPFIAQLSAWQLHEVAKGLHYCFHCPDRRLAATVYQQT